MMIFKSAIRGWVQLTRVTGSKILVFEMKISREI